MKICGFVINKSNPREKLERFFFVYIKKVCNQSVQRPESSVVIKTYNEFLFIYLFLISIRQLYNMILTIISLGFNCFAVQTYNQKDFSADRQKKCL